MITRQRRQSALKHLWMPILTVGFLAYFGFHAFNGSFGKWAMDRLQSEAARLKVELAEIKRERESLERRVAFLRPESLDADMVDVQARAALNVLRADEVVITFGAPQHPVQ